MSNMFKLVAVPHLVSEGEFMGHLETVTFIAANEEDSHKWWAVNTGTLDKDFAEIVSPELATHFLDQLGSGNTVEFPNQCARRCQVQVRRTMIVSRARHSARASTLVDGVGTRPPPVIIAVWRQ